MGSVAHPSCLLAFETATRVASVALLRDGELLGEKLGPSEQTTAESLLPSLDELLVGCGLTLDSVDAFAVSVGPGSFTGLRVGIATLKGLAFGGGRPVAPVSTLAALAWTASDPSGPSNLSNPSAASEPVVAMLDARRGEVYAAAYAASAGPPAREILAEGVYSREDLVRKLPPACVLVGEGVLVCGEWLRERLGSGVRVQPPPASDARARHVAVLGAALLAAGRGIDAAELVPRYLRRAEAEVKRTGERFEGLA
jgi:tRNA threonylcarbamoyladenosine biosynthesis protein TsaB